MDCDTNKHKNTTTVFLMNLNGSKQARRIMDSGIATEMRIFSPTKYIYAFIEVKIIVSIEY